MNLGIVGSRTFSDYELMCKQLEKIKARLGIDIDTIISGGAKGADSLGARYARDNDIGLIEHLPEWEKHGKGAAFIRNSLIVRDSDIIIAFWDGESRGTQHTLTLADKKHVPYKVVLTGD